MNSSNPVANEELLERQQLIFALLMFSAGFKIGSAALQEIINVESALYGVLSVLKWSGIIATIPLLLIFFWQSVKLWRRRVCKQFFEGFVLQANLKAMSISWPLTLLTLTMMTEHINAGQAFPSDFYTKMASVVLMWTFSLSYFLLTRVPTEAEDA